MNFELSHAIDSVKDGTKEVAEIAHKKTSEFHENYVSKIVPDCGKYGDVAKFVAEMAPGVAEYNAIREGDWQAFAISAGIDVAAVAVGAFTAGAGYAALKGGAKATAKVAAKEVAEAGVKKVAKEVVEAGAEKAAKEVVEAGAEKAAKEIAEAGAKKAAKEVAEAGAKKAAKEAVEAGAEKAAKEVVEAGAEKAAKEVAEAGAEKAAKEVAEAGTEATAKEINEIAQVVKNKLDGVEREEKVLKDLISKYGKDNVLREQYLRNMAGEIMKDIETGTARRIDFVVKQGDKIIKSIEVTSPNVDKTLQVLKETRILEHAKEIGGAFIKDPNTGKLLEFTSDLVTEIVRI